MVRRALLTLFPLLLAALTFLSGTPSALQIDTHASAASTGAVVESISIAQGDVAPDDLDDHFTQRVDQDDDPDERIIRVAVAVKWSQPASNARVLRASECAGPTHRSCASHPRAPPTA
jgi:hypothetical protein